MTNTSLAVKTPDAPGLRAIKRLARFVNLGIAGNLALATLIFIVVMVTIGPLIWKFHPGDTNLMSKFLLISREHPLGTDEFGRDLLSRILHGGRLTLLGGTIVLLGSVGLGFTVGAVAGFAGGIIDTVISRIIDGLLALPTLIVALGMVGVLGKSYSNLVLTLILTSWPWFAWAIRGLVRNQRSKIFVLAARASGASPARILFRHIIPNILGPSIVLATTSYGSALLSLTSLSFLGLGIQQPTAEWGAMISSSRLFIQSNPWVVMIPGCAIGITVLAVNFLGDALRDRLDPQI